MFFDDEYDYDIAKMMDILKRNYPHTKVKQGEIYPTNTAPVLIRQNSEITNPSISVIHHRMPLVLDKSQIQEWITDTDSAISNFHSTPPNLEHHAV